MHAALGFVEVSHFGPNPVSLEGWSLAAAAGEWLLPARTVLYPGKPLVLVADAAAFQKRFGTVPNLVEVLGLSLNPRRDQVLLRARNHTADLVSWGEGRSGWSMPGSEAETLCRPNPGKDTNTYLDWAAAEQATPGLAGCGR